MRTDQTTLCTRCAVRFPPARRCPRCGGARLHDLRRSHDRKIALPLLRATPTPRSDWLVDAAERVLLGYLRWGFALLTFVALVLGWLRVGSMPGAVFLALLAAAAQIVLVLLFVGLVSGVALFGRVFAAIARPLGRDAEPPARRAVLPLPPPALVESAERRTFRGRVRCARPLLSPVGHERCAAFRVVGETPGGVIDDGGLAPFDVVDDEGTVCVLDEGAGVVALEPAWPVRTLRPDDALRAFLDERGAFCALGPVRLGESVLRDGEFVLVEGVAATERRAEGYRGQREVTVLRDAPGAPLVLRRAPP